MPHRADRLRAGQEAPGRHRDRVARPDPRPPRRDPARSGHRLGRVAPGESRGTGARGGNAHARARGDEDRLSRVARMSGIGDEEKVESGGDAAVTDAPAAAEAPQVAQEERDESAYKVTLPSF